MSNAARVTSVEAVREFRESLNVFCDDVRQALSAVEMESRRIVDWIAREQLGYWTRMIRVCQEELTQAKQDLFRRQLMKVGGEEPDVSEQRDAVRRAKARLEHAEEKAEKCRKWERALERPIEEYRSVAMQLSGLVEGDPPRIVTVLDRILGTIDAYLTSPVAESRTPQAVARPATETPAHPAPMAEPAATPTATSTDVAAPAKDSVQPAAPGTAS